ncbi:hypothetical protein [uncultured Maribacter sp.]|uniref:hypothetical protein n=1 Tax=uncultured Maribacter sp. TaxID=431308 RepID=UPI002630DC89|nr:hypothetical protein [uncultured Maribacter sp.]
MKKYILIYITGLFSLLSYAHNPDASTTMLVEKENNTWVLQISSSLTAFQQEVRTHFAETPYKTPEEFQQMVLEHIKNNLEISLNDGSKITLGQGIVKLGHETKVVFEVFGIPSDLQSIRVRNAAFKDIGRSQSALFIFKDGFSKEQFILNNDNDHTLNLKVNGNKFVEASQQNAGMDSSYVILIVMSLLGFSFLIQKIILTNDEV